MRTKPALAVAMTAMLASCTTLNFYFYIDVSGATGGGGSSTTSGGGQGGALLCTPGAIQSCYSGPAGTQGVGLCQAGTQACAADGMSWGTCEGEVLPAVEDCATPFDEDCDGMAPACKGEVWWAKRFGDLGEQSAAGIAADAAGNVIVTGYFTSEIDFGGDPLVSMNGWGLLDIFVAKVDADGGHLWSRRFGSDGPDVGSAVTVDGNGDVLIAGHMNGTVNFGGGPMGAGLGAFVAKLDSDGGYLWAKTFGGEARSVATDELGNVLITGNFGGSADFGGGTLQGVGGDDVFVVKLDPSGKYLWAKTFGDTSDQEGHGVAADGMGNVLVTGSFTGSVDFGGGVLQSAGGKDVFVVKLDSDGSYLWAKTFGDANDQEARNMALDGAGNVLLTGYMTGSIDFGGGALASAGGADIFVAKLDPAGNHVWAKRFGDESAQVGQAIAVDATGNVLVTGLLDGAADFGDVPLQSAGGGDVVVVKLRPNGDYLWAKRFGDAQIQEGSAIAADGMGNVLIAGYLSGTMDLGGVWSLESAGGKDVFVAKLSE